MLKSLERRGDVAILALLIVVSTAMLACIVWQADKGLGFVDEGIYLQAAAFPDEIQENVSTIFIYTGALMRLGGGSVAVFRLLGLFWLIGSALALAAGFRAYQIRETPDAQGTCQLYLFILVGALLHYQWSYLTPSYYTFSAVVVNFVCGLALLAITANSRWALTSAFFLGVTLSAAFFAKFTTAIPLAGAIVVLFCWAKTKNSRLLLGVTAGAGFLAWLAFFFISIQSPAVAYANFLKGWELYQTLGYHRPSDKLLVYPQDIGILVFTGAHTVQRALAILVGGSVLLISVRYVVGLNDGTLANVQQGLVAVALLAAAISVYDSGVHVAVAERLVTSPVDGLTRPYIAIDVSFLILATSLLLFKKEGPRRWAWNWDRTLVGAFLILAPLAACLGTSNPLYNVIQFYAAPWFCCILLLLTSARTQGMVIASQAILIMLTFHTASNVIQGSILAPAQIKPRSLLDQTLPIEVGEASAALQVDQETRLIVNTFTEAAKQNGFRRGDDIIAFNQMAGLVFALGGRSPGHPVFPCCGGNGSLYSKLALRYAQGERLKRSLLILNTGPESESDIADILASQGIRYPQDYKLISTVFGLGQNFRLFKPLVNKQNPVQAGTLNSF